MIYQEFETYSGFSLTVDWFVPHLYTEMQQVHY